MALFVALRPGPTVRLLVFLAALHPGPAASQVRIIRHAGNDSVRAVAGKHYQAGGLKRFFLGPTYRDLWAAEITVPVLDLRSFAGGLKPTEIGGGKQTRSLRFLAPDGSDYVFRLVDKDKQEVPKGWKGTVIESVARDQVSAHHPAGAVVVAALLEAAGVLHVTPVLAVLPDDPLLGEFREEFAGRLGSIEPYPTKPDDAPGFAGASQIIESQELRALLDSVPKLGIDVRGYLTARLMDAYLHDWDRHPGNWKWARMEGRDQPWRPLPRDRDKAFMQYGGVVRLAGRFSPNLQRFTGDYGSIRGYVWNSREMDRRLLAGLEQSAWDSAGQKLRLKITDSVIDAAVRQMPREHHSHAATLAATLKQRRDRFPDLARRFYLHLAADPDIHATDAADRTVIARMEDGSVEVRLYSGDDRPWFRRRFHPAETDEIRVYLHDGDDHATVTGDVARSMPVRIIGGNGTNRLIDSSRVAGKPDQARLYDAGTVSHVEYADPDTLFDRRPWVRSEGKLVDPGRDRGSAINPVFGLSVPGDLGLVLKGGIGQTRYGFRVRPYAGWNKLTAEYATEVNGLRLTGSFDRRSEGSRLHVLGRARMSEIEVINFFGFGNQTPAPVDLSFRVEQRQWLLEPAVALALSERSDIRFGPVLKYSTTDSLGNNLVSTDRPYGFDDFGQAGLRLTLHHDRREQNGERRRGILLDLAGDWYPATWDVSQAFGSMEGATAAYYTIPLPLHPVLAVRAGARKVFGEFPFHESAFVGGRSSVRVLELQRYAGDASLHGTAELRFPFPTVPLVLPVATGIYGFAEAGRVYLDGESPGGWHSGAGLGTWIGVLRSTTSISIELGWYEGTSQVRVRTGLSF